MRKLILGALLCGIASCEHRGPATKGERGAPPITRLDGAAGTAPAAGQPLPVLFSAADTLTPPMRELLRTCNLSALWQRPDTASPSPRPSFQGFCGPDHYHFAMVFTQVRRDASNPAVYQVRGKCRYRNKTIRPFSGTLTVRQLMDLPYPGFLAARARLSENPADSLAGRIYTARAQLQMHEEPQANSGVFEGEILLDFYVVPARQPDYVFVFDHEGFDDRLPTRGSGLLLRGNRRNISTGQVTPFIVAPDVGAVARYVLKDFVVDERMGQINPKYAKLGWSNYWENDEWWAESPKPPLL